MNRTPVPAALLDLSPLGITHPTRAICEKRIANVFWSVLHPILAIAISFPSSARLLLGGIGSMMRARQRLERDLDASSYFSFVKPALDLRLNRLLSRCGKMTSKDVE